MKFYKLKDSEEILGLICESKCIYNSYDTNTNEITEVKSLNTLIKEDHTLTAQPDDSIIFVGEVDDGE